MNGRALTDGCVCSICGCSKIEKELQRESDIQRELHRERTRNRRVDLEEDSDDDRPPWERKPYKNRHRLCFAFLCVMFEF